MSRNKLLVSSLMLALSFTAKAQTSSIHFGAKDNWFLERLEIKAGTNNDLNLSTVKPYLRKPYVEVADSLRALLIDGKNPANLTPIDQYNLNRFQSNNKEYSRYTNDDFKDWKNEKKFLRAFFPTKGNAIEINENDFFMTVNPVFGGQIGKETDNDKRMFLNTKGLAIRGLIAKKIAFDLFVTDNQERGPMQFRQMQAMYHQVPGAGYFKRFNQSADDFMINGDGASVYTGAVDYLESRGSVSTNVTKYVNLQFGYDKNFIGDGYRSLFLGNFSNNNLFFKINTRIWKLNYTNLFMELNPSFTRAGDRLLDKKYATMHHLSVNVTKWLNVGVFESVMFGRYNRFDFSYMLPVIFYRSIEQQNGSPDNANVGFNFKANIAQSFQVYGQLMLDELNIKEITKDRTWWGNKNGTQLGIKYVDVAKIKNLDLQLEWNRVRPYTYSHRDSTSNYIHYNMPMAHPLGANFNEVIGVLRYQPMNKLYLTAKVIAYKQGVDTMGTNYGSNPNKPYNGSNRTPILYNGTMQNTYGYQVGTGVLRQTAFASFLASYELFENMFVELNASYRRFKQSNVTTSNTNFNVGLRWNIGRREYDY